MTSSNTQETVSKNLDRTNVIEEGPGNLRGKVWLSVQTHQAQRLIRGRSSSEDKAAIIGLVGFADRLRTIWQASRDDDPYADWWLIKVHDSLEQCRSQIKAVLSELQKQIAQNTDLEVTVATSIKPHRIALRFANPYAFQGAQMICEFDRLLCTSMTTNYVGLIVEPDIQEKIWLCGRKIRGVFALPQGYKFFDINRESLSQNTVKAQKAIELMGELPKDIFNGERYAPLSPRLKQLKQNLKDTHGVRDDRLD